MKRRYLVFDYETYSEVDLGDVGSFEYSMHPTTEIICVAWAIGTREEFKAGTVKVRSWSPTTLTEHGGKLSELVEALRDDKIHLVAHNVLFEKCITHNVLGRIDPTVKNIRPTRWICTAALAATLSLPRNLEDACNVLKLPVKKDMEGNKLMRKWMKPRKPTKANPATRHDDPEELKKIISYCVTDIKAEIHLFLRLPPLHPFEREVWLLDQTINMRGFAVDRPLIKKCLKILAFETERLLKKCHVITGGKIRSVKQTAATRKWLEEHGCMLPNMQAKTVDDAIKDKLATGPAKKLLKVRQALGKSSTSKYEAFEFRSRHDSRVRDILMYHGASTGRWAAMGVQPHNFPRGTLEDIHQAINIIKEDDIDMLRLLYGNLMAMLASCLRGMIVAEEGTVLHVADYSAIEARVLFWVADHHDGMKGFVDGRKQYEELGARIFGMKVEDVTKDSIHRFVGKQAFLGSGYQMGAKKFQATCASFGQEIDFGVAKVAIDTYREVNAPVVTLWGNLQRAAIAAIKNPGTTYKINHTAWLVERGFLWCTLPSGRKLAYKSPGIAHQPAPWDKTQKLEVICFWGQNSKTRQWERQYTYGGKLTENVVQAISRDLMAAAMLRIENHPSKAWEIVLTVHDELVAQCCVFADVTIKMFCDLMSELPPWAKGCPVKTEGWAGVRYRK